LLLQNDLSCPSSINSTRSREHFSALYVSLNFLDSSPEAPSSTIANIYNTCNHNFHKASQFKHSNKLIHMAYFNDIWICRGKHSDLCFPLNDRKEFFAGKESLWVWIWSVLIKIFSSPSALLLILCTD
jgi:hypothetical protein